MNGRSGFMVAMLLALAAVLPLAALPAVAGQNDVRRINGEGNQRYSDEQWAEALEAYREAGALDPQNPILHYNLGNALFRLHDLDQAEAHYRVAAAAEDGDLARQARFNLGNTEFRRAETLEGAGDWQGRGQALGKAIEHWKSVLEDDPTDRDAKRNLELAWRKLREEPPENQQQEQQQQQDQQDEQQQEDGQQQQQDQQEEQDQEQDQEQEQPQQQSGEGEEEEAEEQQQQAGREEQEPQAGEAPREQQEQPAGEQRQEARISEEEAQRILDALRDEELEEQKRQMAERKARGGSSAKDW